MARPGTGGSNRGGSGNRTTSTGRPASSSGRSSGGFSSSSHRNTGGRNIGSANKVNRPTGNKNVAGSGSRNYGSPPPRRHAHNQWVFIPMFGGRRRHRRGYYGGAPVRRRSGGGCLGGIVAFFMIMIILSVLGSLFTTSGTNGTNGTLNSTINRTPLATGSVHETGYYRDELDWIESESTLLKGMKSFYNKTGVQPYLVLTTPVSATNTNEECNQYAELLYDELFTDEGHLLLVYVENLDTDELGYLAYVCGSAARLVIDEEALDILYSNIDNYWFNEALSTSEVFSLAFSKTAETIMKQHTNPNDVLKTFIIVIAVIVLAVVLLKWWKAHKTQKNKEQEDLERTLNVPLEQFGDKTMTDMMKKYDDDEK